MRNSGSRALWKIVSSPEQSDLVKYLERHEPLATVVSDRLRRFPLDRRLHGGGRVHFRENCGAVYQGPGGFFAPFFSGYSPEDLHAQAALRRNFGAFLRPRTIMGAEAHVEALTALLGANPRTWVNYDLLSLSPPDYPRRMPAPRDISIVRPRPDQWRSLLQLQIAYEIEEVLLPGTRPAPEHSKTSLIDSLTCQRVLVAVCQGDVIGRVATNARGMGTDQIGGVYTVPSWRGRGIARLLMTHLLADLAREGRRASLFVKKDNTAARRLYDGLHFSFVSPYRISYYR
ncbi:Acetyltransferase (GNAT) family protein [Alkalispirochaeta americana]|uniref:Acetyltransferase (GNAT) family protein n=1 Tax=Alkalispirochaeta americana TaxID=159291 RepID=A0A1N6WQ54_9SPIO|nr:GNAT family N-acetyltransferase [Alkalispirochaeta americana]SIQ92190.1 Acetyltransferase (GNAT) family protein [Alkalispirochaeta americana]